MRTNDLTTKTVAELKTLAKKKNVYLPAGAKKADIIKALASGAQAKKPVAKKVAKKKAVPAKKTAVSKKSTTKKTAVAKKPVATKAAQSKKIPNAVSPIGEWKRRPKAEEPFMTQEVVADSKYYTGPAQQPLVASYGELPQGYGEEKIALLSRDPHVAYAYWETTPKRIEREKAWFGMESKLCVRIYDITGVQFDGRNAIGYYDQEISDRVGSWYFDLGRPSHAFCADLGLLSSEGRFLTLARSSYITMPRDSVSDVIDEEWMLLDEEFMKIYGIPSGLSSPQIQEMIKQRRKLEITSPGTFSRSRTKRK